MRCPACGGRIRGRAFFCPHCGERLEQSEQGASASESRNLGWDAAADPPRRPGCGRTLAVLLVAALVMLAIAGLGVAGVYYGLRDRAQVERQAVEEHYNKGLAHLAQGEYELASAEFEFVIRLDPKHERAVAKLAEARQKAAAKPTLTPIPQPQAKVAYYDDLRAAYEKKNWAKVFELVDRLRVVDPNYQRSDVDRMLFDALYDSGLRLVQENRLEEAIRLFDRALALQPNQAQVARAKQMATLYLAAASYWNADWAKTIENLSLLYRMAPEYKDVTPRMAEAYINYGDQLAAQQEWCKAEQQYAGALEVAANNAVAAKRSDAQVRCAAAVPATPGPQTPSVSAGTFVGRVTEFINIDGDRILIRGRVLNKAAIGIGGVHVQIKAYTFSAVAVTDGAGQYSFDGINTAVTYTLTLLDRPSTPVDAPGIFGKLTWVNFQETK